MVTCNQRAMQLYATSFLTLIPLPIFRVSTPCCLCFFVTKATRLLPHHPWDCAIDLLPGAIPPHSWVYPLSLAEIKTMEEYGEEALWQGLIKHSTSPASTRFFFVEMKDGGLRPCIDYRGLNAVTVKYPHPLPLVLSAIEHLWGQLFSHGSTFGALTI